ncbi:paramyosin [Orussus abietinus]|uniref:paramyosin n=1 Tax=Orussus abietinus TaxID=222816 RepID=UPI0006260049|nr:paramyosin [Orussus abietinus]
MQIMLNERLMKSEGERMSKHGAGEHSTILQEYAETVERLKQELINCKLEQTNLRSQLESLQNDSKNVGQVVRECLSHSGLDNCDGRSDDKEMILNLQKRVAILQMEKDTTNQLWQMSLRAVDVLDTELKTFKKNGKDIRTYEEQVKNIKEAYSEAIKALEEKLVQTKENFIKHQSNWSENKQKFETLQKEKQDLAVKFDMFRQEVMKKEHSNEETIIALKTELGIIKPQLQQATQLRIELEQKLEDARKFVVTAVAKDSEAKNKVSEAIELVETAVKEKDSALQREARTLDEKLRIERQLFTITEEYNANLAKEVSRVKQDFDRNMKKCLLENKELKLGLKENVMLLERAQRESRLMEEELEKMRHNSDDLLRRSNTKILDLEQKLKDADSKLEVCNIADCKKYKEQTKQLEQQIADLESKLVTSDDRIKRIQMQTAREVEERVREADERTKEAVERYSNLERRLSRALDEKEKITMELRSLQSTFERDIERRDHERWLLDNRVRQLQEDLRKATDSVDQTNARGSMLADQINHLEYEMRKKHCTDKTIRNEGPCYKMELMEQLRIVQDKFDKKTKELSQHVEIHQKLSQKWKAEAKSLTSSFQMKSKELRRKINALRKENEELNKELLACRYQLTQCRVKAIHRYDQGDGTR